MSTFDERLALVRTLTCRQWASAGRERRQWQRLQRACVERVAAVGVAGLVAALEPAHWETLAVFASREGVDRIAELLASRRGARAPTREWWRYTLQLSLDPSPEEALFATRALIDIEEAGGGPAFDRERHVVWVSASIAFLQEHLSRVLANEASSTELSAAQGVINAVRLARVRGK